MSNRTAKFVSAIVAGLLASAPLAMVSHSAAAECLSAPGDQTPDGSHWYYRIEHPSERHCWYLRDEDGKPAQPPRRQRRPSPNRLRRKPHRRCNRSVADARAELPQTGSATTGNPLRPQPLATSRAQMPVLRTRKPRCQARSSHRAGPDRTQPCRSVHNPLRPARSLWPPVRSPWPPARLQASHLPAKPAAAPRAVAAVPLAAADSLFQKSVRLDPDAADRRDGRAVAGLRHGRCDPGERPQTPEERARSARSSARRLEFA